VVALVASLPGGCLVTDNIEYNDENLPAVKAGLLGGDSVEGVGSALDEDDDLARIVDVQELGNTFARLLVSLGRHARLVPGASMDARVNLGEPGHGIADALQRRRAGGVVKVDSGDCPATHHGDRQVDPGEVFAPAAGV